MKLIKSEEVLKLDYDKVIKFYKEYVNPGQVKQISKFGFGKQLAVSSEGINIVLDDGRIIKDFTGGIGVLNHGHNHPRILKVRNEFNKMRGLEVHKNFFSPYVAALSHNIASIFNNVLRYSFFCNSGAESVEGALKLCYKYFKGDRKKVLCTNISFHGKLFMSGGISNSPEVKKIKWPFPGEKAVFNYDDISDFIKVFNQVKNELYAVIIEPFNASSMRFFTDENLKIIRDITAKNKVPLVFDEVYSGWFKTLHMFNFMRVKGLYPDIVTTSKSFGGGKGSIAAFITQSWLFKGAYGKIEDSIIHSTTYNGFGEETLTAIESINICIEDHYDKRVGSIHAKMKMRLQRLQKRYNKLVSSYEGEGALWGLFFETDQINSVAKKVIKSLPFNLFKDPRFIDKLMVSAIIEEMYANYNYLMFFGSNFRIPLVVSTPINVSLDEIDDFFDALESALDTGINELIFRFIKKNIFK